MNLFVYVTAALALAAAPAAYLSTYGSPLPSEDAAADVEAAAVSPSPEGPLVPLTIRLLNVDEPQSLAVSVWRGEEDLFAEHVPAFVGESLVEGAVPAEPVEVRVAGRAFAAAVPLDPASCDGRLDVLIVTHVDLLDLNAGGAMPGPRCLQAQDETLYLHDEEGYSLAAPWPTCPLECTMGYSFAGGARQEFEVREGATSIEVVAAWVANSPTAEERFVGLFTPDSECGEGCWMGVAGESGSGLVAFEHLAPAPGPYSVSGMAHGPGVGLDERVHIEVVVRYS